MPKEFINVGGYFYKIYNKPESDKSENKTIEIRTKDAVKHELIVNNMSPSSIYKIPLYNAFIFLPSHVDYEQTYRECYNVYFELTHKIEAGTWENIELFLKHMFQEQYEVILDYFQLLYLQPMQKLPILCLVSKKKSTGKTTFINFIHSVFQSNVLSLTSEDFDSQFNAEWAGKLFLCLEEIKFEDKKVINKLKTLSTGKRISIQKKTIDQKSQQFYSKIIINSNHEDDFIKLEDTDNRFWVRDVKEYETEDVYLESNMEKEIPHFLCYLKTRSMVYENKTRFWFDQEVTYTDALQRVVLASKPKIESIVAHALISAMDYLDSNEIQVSPSDISNLLGGSGKRTTDSEVRRMLKNNWNFKPTDNTQSYQKVTKSLDGSFSITRSKGRYYTIDREYLEENFK